MAGRCCKTAPRRSASVVARRPTERTEMTSPMGTPAGHQVRVTGIAWFRKEDYAAARAIMADAERLPETCEKWRYRADRTSAELAAQGVQVIRAIIDPAEFPLWCSANGLNVDAEGRMAFASAKAAMADRAR